MDELHAATEDLAEIAERLTGHLRDIRGQVAQLNERDLRITRALDELRLLGIDIPPEEHTDTPAESPTSVARPVAPDVARAPSKATPKAPKAAARPRGTSVATAQGTVDYTEIARVYQEAVTAGRPPVPALVERFGVPRTTAKNWPTVCRKLGLLTPPERFTTEPITKMPVDHQKIRDEQAGPPGGPVRGLTGDHPRPQTAPVPQRPSPPAWTPERAREHLQAVSQ